MYSERIQIKNIIKNSDRQISNTEDTNNNHNSHIKQQE